MISFNATDVDFLSVGAWSRLFNPDGDMVIAGASWMVPTQVVKPEESSLVAAQKTQITVRYYSTFGRLILAEGTDSSDAPTKKPYVSLHK